MIVFVVGAGIDARDDGLLEEREMNEMVGQSAIKNESESSAQMSERVNEKRKKYARDASFAYCASAHLIFVEGSREDILWGYLCTCLSAAICE